MRRGLRPRALVLIVTLAMLISVTTLTAFAVTYTLVVKTDRPSYSGSDIIQITGTVSPAPKPNATSAFVTVKNPIGEFVAVTPAVVSGSSGTFQYKFTAGGTKLWIVGVYSVNASWSATIDTKPIWNTTTFQYSPTVTTTTTTTTTTTSTTSTTTTSTTTTTNSTTSTTTTTSTSSSTSTSSTSSTTTQAPTSTTTTTAQTTSAAGTGILSTINLLGIGGVAVGVAVAAYLLRRRGR